MNEKRKGLPIDECVRRARKCISEQGMYLLLFDVKESRKFPDYSALEARLADMAKDLSSMFSDYLPENSLAFPDRVEKGFSIFRGDSGVACLNSADVIHEIRDYQAEKYPDIYLYWSVARDYNDKEGFGWVVV